MKINCCNLLLHAPNGRVTVCEYVSQQQQQRTKYAENAHAHIHIHIHKASVASQQRDKNIPPFSIYVYMCICMRVCGVCACNRAHLRMLLQWPATNALPAANLCQLMPRMVIALWHAVCLCQSALYAFVELGVRGLSARLSGYLP